MRFALWFPFLVSNSRVLITSRLKLIISINVCTISKVSDCILVRNMKNCYWYMTNNRKELRCYPENFIAQLWTALPEMIPEINDLQKTCDHGAGWCVRPNSNLLIFRTSSFYVSQELLRTYREITSVRQPLFTDKDEWSFPQRIRPRSLILRRFEVFHWRTKNLFCRLSYWIYLTSFSSWLLR